MKFKFNYEENKLWKIEDNYFYEISENDRQLEYRLFGVKVTFKLAKNHYLLLNSDDEFRITMTACYAQPLKAGEMAYYQKKITRNWWQTEIIFEFTEADKSKNNHPFCFTKNKSE